MRPLARLGGVLAAITVVAVAGCGGGGEPAGVTISVTSGYGADPISKQHLDEIATGDTLGSLLARSARVERVEGRIVAIDGRRARGDTAWFAYVNGDARGPDAAKLVAHDGDSVWWDLHDVRAGAGRSVVGTFPEPFAHGVEGKRVPVRVECADPDADACREVAQRLVDAGTPAARGVLRAARMLDTLRVLVGTWDELRGDEALAQLERGPRASGVYARPAADGSTIAALDATGAHAEKHGPGTGLIAATRFGEEQPVWAVTGTDAAGLEAAVQAFDEAALAQRMAVLVDAGLPVALPTAR